jgi:hypothetical protein
MQLKIFTFLFPQALAACNRAGRGEAPEALYCMSSLATLLEKKGTASALTEAEALHRAAAAGRARVLGPEHPHSLDAQLALADFLVLHKRSYVEAQPILQVRPALVSLFGCRHEFGITCSKC